MLHSLDARRDRLLTNSLHTQTSGAELHQIKLAHSMRVHPSDSLSLQSGKSPLHRSSPAGSSRVGPLLQVPSPDIRAPCHASRRVHKPHSLSLRFNNTAPNARLEIAPRSRSIGTALAKRPMNRVNTLRVTMTLHPPQ